TEDLATNGIWSFTGFYIIFNNFLLFIITIKILKIEQPKS
ncbi:DUF5966 family protein, partial [Streptococcus suis]